MYEKFYKLTGKPFQLNPDPRFYFKSKEHVRAMAYLCYGLQQGQGFIIVTGDIGTGKTMLVNNLFRELEAQNVIAAKIVSTNVKETDLLRLLAAEFKLPYEKINKATLLLNLREFFQRCVDDGKRVLLIIDECQNLPRSSLEELRMLLNHDYKGMPLVQSFLLGQREFRGILRAPGLEQLRQRVIAAHHLKPLSVDEIKEYVLHRLQKVGWQDDPQFEEGLFVEVFRFTGGVPRRINTFMDRLLLRGALEHSHTITLAELTIVAAEIKTEQGVDEPESDHQSVDPLTDDEVIAAPRAAADTVRVAGSGQVDLHRLEEKLDQKLAQMQQMVTRLSVAAQASLPPRIHVDDDEKPFPIWRASVVGALLFVLLGIGAVLYYVMSRAAH